MHYAHYFSGAYSARELSARLYLEKTSVSGDKIDAAYYYSANAKSDMEPRYLMEEDKTTLEAVHRLMLELAETRGKMKAMKDDLKDIAEQNEEYRALAEDLKEASLKKQTAKKLLEADKDYQVVNAELEELKFKMKDLQEIMSHHLVTYFSETNETSIETPEGESIQVVVSAKLGKNVA